MSHEHTEVEEYALDLITEEVGEVLQVIGKAGRFGLDTPGVKDPLTGVVNMELTPRIALNKESGDLLAAIHWASVRGVLDWTVVDATFHAKLRKLMDPKARDNLGRRLAPGPTEVYSHPDGGRYVVVAGGTMKQPDGFWVPSVTYRYAQGTGHVFTTTLERWKDRFTLERADG